MVTFHVFICIVYGNVILQVSEGIYLFFYIVIYHYFGYRTMFAFHHHNFGFVNWDFYVIFIHMQNAI